MIDFKDYQVGQKLYFYCVAGTTILTVIRKNKKTMTMAGTMDDPEKNKLYSNGIVKQANEYYDLHICTKKEYIELRNAFYVTRKFRELIRAGVDSLSIPVKEKIISLVYQDKQNKSKA